jgi:hypothetical protein
MSDTKVLRSSRHVLLVSSFFCDFVTMVRYDVFSHASVGGCAGVCGELPIVVFFYLSQTIVPRNVIDTMLVSDKE